MGFKSRRSRARNRDELSIALGISNIVCGRENDGLRVTYLVDPRGRAAERAIAEKVVMWRWQKRRTDGMRSRHRDRLEPYTWRTLGIIFDADYRSWNHLNVEDVQGRIAETRIMR